ncbi:MAG: hypothetical protein FJ118_13455 [Deltaproteobacteria bacterium]|nr:hypothetical protein [Deltaproteobacteria bacterium]
MSNPRSLSIHAFFFIAAFLAALVVPKAVAGQDALPPEIADIKMGAPSTWVIEKIKDAGEHSIGEPPKLKNWKRITWKPAKNRSFKRVEFDFSGQDQLYLIRLALKDEVGETATAIRNALLARFNVPKERPGRLQAQDKEMFVYGTGENAPFLFEVTDLGNREKLIEIYDKELKDTDFLESLRREEQQAASQGKRTDKP